MEDQDLRRFSWISFYLITSVCFFLFAFIMKVLEGVQPRIFLWTGLIALVLGLLNLFAGESRSAGTDS